MEGLKPYPAYKESGLPWLGRVPAHWETRRTKVLFRERVEKGHPEEPLLAATQSKGVVRKEDYGNRTVTAQKDFHLLKLVKVGDFVISLRSFEGGIEVAHCRGIISPAYTVLEPRTKDISGYFRHFFKSPNFISSLTLFVTGIREGQNIDYERLSRAFMPLPPRDEQAAIVRYLDHATRKIDQAIRAKRKIIALLNEQKQAIIHRAVTRGLDPDVPLKDSGIPWLGQIPAHWEVVRLGRTIRLTTGYPFGSSDFSHDARDIRLLRGINVTPGKIRWDDVVRWPSSRLNEVTDFSLCIGDIVLGMDRPIVSGGVRVAQVQESDLPTLLLQRVARIRPTARITSQFVVLLLAGRGFAEYLEPIFTGISVPHMSPAQIKGFAVPLPPVVEQSQIVEWINSETQLLEATIQKAEHEISLLREYRTRLVADVVTGKLDVREAAARLPEPEAEAVPEIAAAEDDEEVLEEAA